MTNEIIEELETIAYNLRIMVFNVRPKDFVNLVNLEQVRTEIDNLNRLVDKIKQEVE